jgi:DoxX-like family
MRNGTDFGSELPFQHLNSGFHWGIVKMKSISAFKGGKTLRSRAKDSQISPKVLWTGRIISALAVLFLLFDGILKLLRTSDVVDITVQLGYPESIIVSLGIVLIASTILYVIPSTTCLGAILLTGYLGGAVATHVRAGGPLFSILFPVILGVLIWGGFYLRDKRLRAIIPLRS